MQRGRLFLSFFICVTVAAASIPAMADDIAEAKKLFMEAEKHFNAGEYEQALDLYKQAYEKKPLPGFHFNIGQCYRNLGKYDLAIEHYRNYLEHAKNPKRRADVEKLIEESQKKLDEQKPAVVPEPTPPPEPVPPIEEKQPEPEPEPEPVKGKGLSPVFFWTGVGVTAAMLLTGTITGAMALSKSSEFKDPTTPYGDLQDLKDSGTTLKTTSSVTFAIGAVAAVGTTVLFFFTDFGSKETEVSGGPIPGGGMVTLGGSF
jgi:hypothetical protein